MSSMTLSQPDFHGFAISMVVIPSVVVALRFWSRALNSTANGLRFWWDDWLVLAALIFSIGASALHLYMLSIGLGQHVKTLSASALTEVLKSLWASYWLSDFGLSLSKASVLFFYARVFTTHTRWFKYGLWVAHALNILWWLSSIARVLLFCYPVYKYWDTKAPGFCRSPDGIYIASAVPSVFIDLFILILPIPLIYQLSLKTGRKILVIAIFLCGYLVIGISIGRLVVSITYGEKFNEDLTYNGIPLLFLVDAELPLSIIGCSFPTLFYLFRRGIAQGTRSLFSTKASIAANSYALRNRSPSQHRLQSSEHSLDVESKGLEDPKAPRLYTGIDGRSNAAATRGSSRSDLAEMDEGQTTQGIMVYNDFYVSHEKRP